MAKQKKAPSPAAESKKQAAADRRLEAQKLKDIYDNAFRKGQHMAMRAAAKQEEPSLTRTAEITLCI